MNYNPLDLSGKRVLVTGASSGIGRETAQLMARLGARVLGLARDAERLEHTRQALVGDGHAVRAVELDESDALPGVLKDLAAEHGPFDALVHAAGIQRATPLRVARADDYVTQFRVNTLSAAMILAAVAKRGVAQPAGCSVVLVGSVMSVVGAAGLGAYCSSKAALVGLMKAAALELAPLRVRVNCVLPGLVDTEMSRRHRAALGAEQVRQIEQMHPLGFGEATDVAHAIAFLASDAARWITGSSLVVDGGYSVH